MDESAYAHTSDFGPQDPEGAAYFTAETGSHIGIQAENVTGSTVHMTQNVYQAPPGTSAEEKFRRGAHLLANGVPLRARVLIIEALAEGYDSAEVRFHLALAILSKRAYRDLATSERDELAAISEVAPSFADDEWRRGLEAICALLDYVRSRSGPESAQEKLLNLKAHQRESIEQHLDLVLDGVVKDGLWGEILRRAQEDQHCSQRTDRVWAYFQPVPMEARARYAVKQELDPAVQARLVGWSALLALTIGYIGLSALTLGRVWPIVTVVAAVIAGYVAVSNAVDWRYRVERLRTRDFEHFGQPQQGTAPRAASPTRSTTPSRSTSPSTCPGDSNARTGSKRHRGSAGRCATRSSRSTGRAEYPQNGSTG
jgi:hypothetical protein